MWGIRLDFSSITAKNCQEEYSLSNALPVVLPCGATLLNLYFQTGSRIL